MSQSYSTIINSLKQFAQAHLVTQRFKCSFIEQLDNFTEEDVSFPILFATPDSIGLEENIDSYNFRIYCLDILQKDRNNEEGVMNNTLLVLSDLVNWLRLDDNNSLNLLNSPVAQPLNNFGVDSSAGWYIDLEIEATGNKSDCAIPFSPLFQLTGITCDVQTIHNFLTCETVQYCNNILYLHNRSVDTVSLSANSISATTFYSGTTALSELLTGIGGATTLPTNQIAFGSVDNTVSGNSLYKIFSNNVGGGYAQLGYVNIGYGVALGGAYGIDLGAFSNAIISCSNNFHSFDRGSTDTYGNQTFGISGVEVLRLKYQEGVFSTPLRSLAFSATTVSADTFYSGTTALSELLTGIGGTTIQTPNQIAFGNSTSGLTGSSSFLYDDSVAFRHIDIGQGGLQMGFGSSGSLLRGIGGLFNICQINENCSLHLNSNGALDYSANLAHNFYNGHVGISTPSGYIPIYNLEVSGSAKSYEFSATTISAGTFYSGSTNLYDIFGVPAPAFLAPQQIAFGSASSAITSVSAFYYYDPGKYMAIDAMLIGKLNGTYYGYQANNAAIYAQNSNAFFQVNGDGSTNLYSPVGFTNSHYFSSPIVTASTVSADTIQTNTISATTFYSGSTNLSELFTGLGGTSIPAYLEPNQVAFGSSSSGITSSPNLFWFDGVGSRYFIIDSTLIFGKLTPSNYGMQTTGGANLTLYGPANTLFLNTDGTIAANSTELSNTGGIRGSYLSATSISATTFYSGSTNLSTLLTGLGGGGTQTFVQPGSNIQTGGTSSAPTVGIIATPIFANLVVPGQASLNTVSASIISAVTTIQVLSGITSRSFSAATVSGGTIYSGGTNLSNLIISVSNAAAIANNDFTRVQPGTNITTGGTGNAPVINVSSTPTFTSVSATTILGRDLTIQSGFTAFSGSMNQLTVNNLNATQVTSSQVNATNFIASAIITSPSISAADVISTPLLSATTISVVSLSGDSIFAKSTGTAPIVGTATLGGGGKVVVNTSKVTSNSIILLSINDTVGPGAGFCYEDKGHRNPGSDFTIASTNPGDTYKVAWFIVEPKS